MKKILQAGFPAACIAPGLRHVFAYLQATLAIVLLFSAPQIAQGQTSTQSFGSSTGSHTSTTGSTSFLTSPTSGTTWARAGGGGSPSINMVTSSNPLGTTGAYVKASASSSTSVSKVSPAVGYTAGKVFYTKFVMLLGDASAGNTATTGEWRVFQGAGSMYSDANDFTGSQVFTGFRFTFGSSGALTLENRNGSSWNGTGLLTQNFFQGALYTVEMIGNNQSSSSVSYTYSGTSQSVAINTYDLYINGVLVGDDLAKAAMSNNTDITSLTFIGESSTSNAANMYLDDVVIYNAVPSSITGPSASNPSAYSLSSGSYTFTSWASSSSQGTYPSNMVFHFGDVNQTDPTLAQVNATADYTMPYNLSSQTRINGQGSGGFSFINTGSSHVTTTSGNLGEAVLGLNTTGRNNIRVSWKAGTQTNNSHPYKLRAQYRIGHSGSYTDLPGTTAQIEYTSPSTAFDNTSSPITLPAGCENQSEVQIRWVYYHSSGSGNRDEIYLDDITVSSSSISVVVSNTNLAQYGTQSLARNTTSTPVSRFQVVVSGGTAQLSSLSFGTTGDNTNCNYVQSDITNFKLYYTTGTTFSTTNPVGGATTQASGKVTTNASETITFSGLTQNLAAGTYYIWITADILSGATAGRTIKINAPSLSISSGNLTGSSSATGVQTVVAGTPTNYYLTGNNAGSASNWNTATDGSGTALSTLASPNDVNLIVDDETAAFITGDVTLGSNSKFIVSQGVTAKLTINGVLATATVDVGSAGTLELQLNNTQLAVLTLGTLSSGSEVIYDVSGSQNITSGTFDKLTLGGSGTKSLAGTTTISSALTIPSGIKLAIGSNTLTINGSLSGSGTITGSSTSNISIGGSGAFGTLNVDASTPGTTNVFNNFTLNRSLSTVSISDDVTIGGALALTDGILDINGKTLTLNGTISATSGTVKGSTASNLSIGGSGAFGTIYMDATTPGTTNVLNDFTFNRSTSGTLSLGNAMQVAGIVTHSNGTLTTGGFLTLKATGATSYGQIAGTGSGSISGNITAEFQINSGDFGWRSICSPLDGATLAQLSDDVTLNFGTPDSRWANVYYFDEASADPYWQIPSGTSASMNNTVYSIFMGTPTTGTLPVSLDITGTYKGTGNYSVSGLTLTGSEPNVSGWHYIRNPWPSGFTWDGTVGNIQGNQAYVYDQSTGVYTAFDDLSNGVIPPFTPLTVMVQSNNVTATLPNSKRITATTANYFDKTFPADNYISLKVKNTSTGFTDEAKWYTNANAKNGFDALDGVKKLNSAAAPSIYYANGNRMINKNVWEKMPEEADLPLVFHTEKAGSYEFSLHTENLEDGVQISLEDVEAKRIVDIAGGTYTFNYTDTTKDRNFILHLNKKSGGRATGTGNINADNIIIGMSGNTVVLKSITGENAALKITDLLGRDMFTNNINIAENSTGTIEIPACASGYYLLKLTTAIGTTVKKIWLSSN